MKSALRSFDCEKLLRDETLIVKVREWLLHYSQDSFLEGGEVVARFKELAYMLARDSSCK